MTTLFVNWETYQYLLKKDGAKPGPAYTQLIVLPYDLPPEVLDKVHSRNQMMGLLEDRKKTLDDRLSATRKAIDLI